MSSKNFAIGIVLFSLILIIGAYFLISGGNNELPNNDSNLISYSINDKQKPVVEVKATFLDMGQIKVSEKKEKEFVIKNIGQKSLQLSKISSSCNCTTGQIIYEGKESKEYGMHAQSENIIEIAPQKEAKIRVIYRPFVMPVYGIVEREVYISTNDPKNPKLVFKIKAVVQ